MLSMYEIAIPSLKRMLNNLSSILKKGEAHADDKKIDHSVFLNARLAPDMFTLTRQVQIATDTAKGAAHRLAGREVPALADTETSFAELAARIENCAHHARGFQAG